MNTFPIAGMLTGISLAMLLMAPAIAHAGGGRHAGYMMMGLAERYDGNQDGKVSQDEINTNRAQWHGEFDADKSGQLSIDEFEKLWLKARREEMVREFQDFDRDGDAKVTLEEYKRPMSDVVMNMDRNGDGILSLDDRRKRKSKMPDNNQ